MIPSSWRPVAGGYEHGDPSAELRYVCIPGIRGDPVEFIHLVPRLSGRVRVIRTPAEGASLREIAHRVLDDLPHTPFNVIGASFGGLLGWAMPPTRVRRLLTIGSLPERTASAGRVGVFGAIVKRTPDVLFRWFYGARTDAALRTDGISEPRLQVPPKLVLARRLQAVAAWELPPRPPCPARCLWGRDDTYITWTEERVRELGMEPVVVSGGHFPHLSHPDEVLPWVD